MKTPAFLTLASTLLVSACASTPQEKADVQAPEASASTSTVHTYRCESGETIAAAYPSTDSARVEYKDRRYDMQIAVSGSGARYAGDDLEWWTKGSGPGSEGILFRHLADGTTGERLELCEAS